MAICRTLLTLLYMFACSVSALAVATHSAQALNLFTELSPAQQDILHGGGRVMITNKVPGYPWPGVRVYQIVSVLPEQITAVFFDYEAANTYVPHLRQSTISKKIDSCTYEVDYRIKIPVMPDEAYTVRNSLRMLPGGTYEITWKLLRATTTRSSDGSFRAQPYEKSKTIFCYSNIVVPGSRFAIVLQGLALDQVQKNVDALVAQVMKQKTENPKALQHQVNELRKALETVSSE